MPCVKTCVTCVKTCDFIDFEPWFLLKCPPFCYFIMSFPYLFSSILLLLVLYLPAPIELNAEVLSPTTITLSFVDLTLTDDDLQVHNLQGHDLQGHYLQGHDLRHLARYYVVRYKTEQDIE